MNVDDNILANCPPQVLINALTGEVDFAADANWLATSDPSLY